MPCGALEVAQAHERTVDAGRRKLEPIGLGHDVLGVEHRRQGFARALTIVDRHRAVRSFGHDLYGRAGGGGDFYPHEPEAEIAQHRRRDPADPKGLPRVLDQARLVERFAGAGG